MVKRPTKKKIYDESGDPCAEFNKTILNWLGSELQIREHKTPAAFEGARNAYDKAVKVALEAGLSRRDAHREVLSTMTELLFGYDLAKELEGRLNPGLVNETGFRTTLSQGVAKNVGENFVNLMVYALADLLQGQDEILIDKGLPPALKKALTLKRTVPLKTGEKELRIPIEGDLAIFSRSQPLNAIVISAKTRLKEVFHIGTMWKLLFDTLGDQHCLDKWGLNSAVDMKDAEILYVFATADMVREGGRNSQGPDVERDEPRNLIAMDASFFDYVFVSKTGIPHVGDSIDPSERGALFHELGCLIDLTEKKFGIDVR